MTTVHLQCLLTDLHTSFLLSKRPWCMDHSPPSKDAPRPRLLASAPVTRPFGGHCSLRPQPKPHMETTDPASPKRRPLGQESGTRIGSREDRPQEAQPLPYLSTVLQQDRRRQRGRPAAAQNAAGVSPLKVLEVGWPGMRSAGTSALKEVAWSTPGGATWRFTRAALNGAGAFPYSLPPRVHLLNTYCAQIWTLTSL